MPPAARVTDMHTCPMVTPGVPPIPHVGGPIMPPGVPTVLIDFLPAATITNMAVCVGPPDIIVKGSAGVFINFLPAARLGDQTAHGGVIVMGSPTCIIGEIGSPSPGCAGAGAVVAGLVVAGLNGSFAATLSLVSTGAVVAETQDEQSGTAGSGKWTVAEVKALIKSTNPEVLDQICKKNIPIYSFDTAYDKWKYDSDGREEESELKGLLGNTDQDRNNSDPDKKEIRIRQELSSNEAASTLFHELSHAKRAPVTTKDEYLQQEIDVRVDEEQFRQAQGMPPANAKYRTKDGKPDIGAIDASIRNSSHYNPIGRKRVGRRYVGWQSTSGWCPP